MTLASHIAAVVSVIGADVKAVYSRLIALEFYTQRWLRCTKLTDTTITGNTPVNVPNMSVTLVANASYHFKFNIVFRSSKSIVGVAFTLTGPAGYRALAYNKITPNNAATAVISTSNTYSVVQTTLSTPETNKDCFATLEGVIAVGTTGGAFTLQAASEDTNAITIRLGTNGIIERVA